ncbi:hypothetical protein F7725_012706 [Dissostichus mawsoni]|uniref:Arrestin C-terminal-like domain-containing protein n=1 Tax=Dissostichus mawsoni TaxID=36200 RepID=A0A7J5YN09_DISMA|nr:hypothetical protein F7725_012706 [Dissostichus mawsoni]
MTINSFAIEYDAINSRNTFTNGDSINGRIIVEVSKETTVQSIIFVAKGKARVRWSEHYGRIQHHVYWADEQYYDIKHHILRESRQDGNALKLSVKGDMYFLLPSRFLTELKQSMKLTKKAKTHFTFVSKADMDIPGLLEPQYGSKSVKVFGSGIISMDVRTKRMGYKQGRDLKVSVEIVNNSSRSVKAKVILYEKKSFFAQGRRRVCTKEILKEKMEAVASSNKETVVKVMNIPRELPSSILNCSIIKLEYRLKVHLDVQYASDPEITLPIVILPASEDTPKQQQPSDAGFGFDGFGNPEQAPWSPAPHQPAAAASAMDPPPPYAAHAMCPLAASGFGFEPFEPPAWGTVPPQPPSAPSAPQPSDPPPAYGTKYDAINSRNTFTNGDSINGRIIVEVSKETTIQSLIFIAKGKARVRWSEHYGQHQHHVYCADEKYYDIKHHILRESRQDGNVITFSFIVLDSKIPSSFKSGIGNIHHKLKAELKQSMKLTKKAKTHFTFVSKADMDIPGLLEPQYGSKDKSVKVFGSGVISMDVRTKRMGYKQGRDLKVSVEIVNNSSRSVKAKVILYEKKSFFAQGRRRVCTKEILKEKMEAVASSNKETVVKVHLDVKYASDPEITLPIVILPASEDTPKQQQPSDAGFGFDGFGNPEQAPGARHHTNQQQPPALWILHLPMQHMQLHSQESFCTKRRIVVVL